MIFAATALVLMFAIARHLWLRRQLRLLSERQAGISKRVWQLEYDVWALKVPCGSVVIPEGVELTTVELAPGRVEFLDGPLEVESDHGLSAGHRGNTDGSPEDPA